MKGSDEISAFSDLMSMQGPSLPLKYLYLCLVVNGFMTSVGNQ